MRDMLTGKMLYVNITVLLDHIRRVKQNRP